MKAVRELPWRCRATSFVAMAMVMVSACHTQESQAPATQTATPIAVTNSTPPVVQAWSIRLVVSGGFAGEQREIAIDSASGKAQLTNHKSGQRDALVLAVADRAQIAQMVSALPAELTSHSNNDCNDCYSFDLDVSRDGVAQSARLESLMLSDSVYGALIAKLLTVNAGVTAHP